MQISEPSRAKIVVSLAACLIVGAMAALWAVRFMGSLVAYRSPLRLSPPTPGPALGQPLTQRVIFILVDALRLDTSLDASVMPALAAIREQGASARMHSRPPSYSEPGYTALLTGAWPDIHDGPPINLPYDEIYPFTQDDIFSAVKRAGLHTAVSGYYWFEKLIPQSVVDASFYTPGEDREADIQVVEAAMSWIANPSGYQLILVHIDQVDYAGHHQGGPRDLRWNQAARRADALIERMTEELDLSQDTVLIVSDHGQIDRGGHGGNEPVVLLEPFILAGRGVIPGFYGDIQMTDIAPTLAALLGVNIPASSQGRVLVELLDLTPSQIEPIEEASRIQQLGLLDAYQKANEVPWLASWVKATPAGPLARMDQLRVLRLTGERLPRAGLALLAAGIPAIFILRRREKTIAWWFAGALTFLASFHLGYALLLGRTYSLSSVDSAQGVITSIVFGSVLPFLVGWLIITITHRPFKPSPRQMGYLGAGYTWMVIYLLTLPVLFSFVLNGLLVTWTLPELSSAFLGFLASLQICVAALAGVVISTLSALLAAFLPGAIKRIKIK